jgi:hypothetical protein
VSWTFVYLMVGLKIPIIALLWIVWWAIHQEPEPAAEPGDGGIRKPVHPRRPLPRLPRRGPHAEASAPAPPRTRTVLVRARRMDHA